MTTRGSARTGALGAASKKLARWPMLVALGVLALMVWSFYARLALLTSSPYPLGIDGYFYPIQLRAALADGSLYYPSSPLTVWLMMPLAALTDPIVGAKLGAALAGGLLPLPAYVLGRRLGGSSSAGLLAAVLAATSAESFYLGTEFVKNSWGATAAMSFLAALGWALARTQRAPADERARSRKWPWIVVFGLLLVTALTHKLALVLAVLLGAPPVYRWWRDHGRAQTSNRALSRVLIGLMTGFVLAGVWAPAAFPSVGDLALLSGLFGGSFEPSLPVLEAPGGAALYFQYEVALAGALAGLLIVARRVSRRAVPDAPADSRTDGAMESGLIGFALVLCVPVIAVDDPQGLGYRLRLMAFVPLCLCAAALAGRLLARLASHHRRALLAPFALAFLLARPTGGDEGVVRVHPAMQAAMRALPHAVPPGDVIAVPERHLMFMAAYYGHRATRLRAPSGAPEHSWRLLPLAHISPALRRAIEAGAGPGIRNLHPAHPQGLVLIHESNWPDLLVQLPPDERTHYRRWHTL